MSNFNRIFVENSSNDMYTVYTITENGVVKYVGKTKDYTRRKWDHLNSRGTYMSAIPIDIDLSTVEIKPIALYTDEVQALKFEDWMIQKHDTINNGWNKQRSGNIYADDVNAYNNTPERKAWKNAWQKAYEQTPERKARKKAWQQEHKARHNECNRQYYLRKKQEKLENKILK